MAARSLGDEVMKEVGGGPVLQWNRGVLNISCGALYRLGRCDGEVCNGLQDTTIPYLSYTGCCKDRLAVLIRGIRFSFGRELDGFVAKHCIKQISVSWTFSVSPSALATVRPSLIALKPLGMPIFWGKKPGTGLRLLFPERGRLCRCTHLGSLSSARSAAFAGSPTVHHSSKTSVQPQGAKSRAKALLRQLSVIEEMVHLLNAKL